ncbi:PspC domain-containing protein [Winogradskyella litorisediminis]|uniref:PspC domain-containing protein n=1 Tax=Winogradskyella litorisediminis TaxID=1156618 RepID=A0ABW3NB13_9FLAO
MNKTVNINLAGIFFHIDEDAYLKLSRYLEAIKRSFTDSQGRSEIIADIEARIAELFTERIQNDKQVVGIKLVDDVITIMGQPEDYLVDDEIFEDEPVYAKQSKSKSGSSKKLFRDTENSYIGGVAAGLSHYLGIEMIWVRLLWVVLTLFSGGTFLITYLIFWALVPEASTTAEKLTMTGEPVNISNIEKKIKDGFDIVSEKVKNVDFKKHSDNIKEGFENVADNITDTVKSVDFDKQGESLKRKSRSFFGTIGDIIMFFLTIFAKFFGVVLIIIGISMLVALLIAFFTVGITDAVHFPPMNFLDAANAANIPIWLMSFLLFFAIGIPFFFVFYLGLKILINNLKSIGNIAKFTLLGLWLCSIIGITVIGVKQATEHAYDANVVVSEKQLNIKTNDTIRIKMMSHDKYNRNSTRNHHGYKIFKDENGKQQISSSDVRLVINSTKDSVASIKLKTFARGRNYDVASQRAENINYNYNLVNGELQLDSYFTTEFKNKLSDQHVTIYLNLPEGSSFITDRKTYNFQYWIRNNKEILRRGLSEKYLTVDEDKVICNSCTVEETTTDSFKKDKAPNGIKIDENGIEIKTDANRIEVNENGVSTNNSEVKVKINEDGVQITTEDKDN